MPTWLGISLSWWHIAGAVIIVVIFGALVYALCIMADDGEDEEYSDED